MNYTPLHCHSHYSLLDGLSQPKHIVARLNELQIDTCALTDHGTISGCVDFAKTMKKAKKKAILGCELYVCAEASTEKTSENKALSHQVVLAKNLQGWRSLIRLVSDSNHPDRFYYKPRVDFDLMAQYCHGNTISFSGHLGSTLANYIQNDGILHDDWLQRGSEIALEIQDIFGKGNFFIEIQLIDSKINIDAHTTAECMRMIAKKTKIPCVATPDAHYCRHEDADDHRVLLATNLHTTLSALYQKLQADPEMSLGAFFKSDNYHIPSIEELQVFHTEEEIANTNVIADMCDDYDILNKPQLPEYICENNQPANECLREYCKQGWRRLMSHIQKDDPRFHQYGEQVKTELTVLESADLSSYFLIVKDICDYVRNNGWLLGPGRGSAAGCLVSYLLGITSIDPLKHDLLFERFYNAGRNTKDHVSYPDIDIDVPKNARNKVIQYIKERYGYNNVAQIITYQTLKGRSALKRVLNVHGELSFDEQNAITQNIVDESKIADELQEMEDASIIRWALENKQDALREWCVIDDDGNLTGSQADKFAQAIRLEGTKVTQSKHPAGVVISTQPLEEICPLVIDKEDQQLMAALEGPSCEDIGLIKFDVLGITMLDKVMGVAQIIQEGDITIS